MTSYADSSLWTQNLAPQHGDDPYQAPRERLRRAFIQTREAVTPLIGFISNDLPDLTVHDITHLDALWQVADVLMGENFTINPAETFVLGMAFLIHDAATTIIAYPGGIKQLQDTTEWNDFVATQGFKLKELTQGSQQYQRTLFETLRLLHAQRAEKLLTQSWPDLNKQERWLMEDVELRNYYGCHIGKIAASHGRDVASVEIEWANVSPITPHSSLGLRADSEWKVDCLKIALLLRCIDAAHIDSQRAPDMLSCFVQPSGVSRAHWRFQNNLGSIGIDRNNNELYWSSRPFGEHEIDEWWLCYSTMQMIDREIRTANRILQNNHRPHFAARRVKGVQDLSEFRLSVPVDGWEPVDVRFQLGQVGDVIEKLGGEKLYGNKPHVVLRELIQNAADAIRAKRITSNDPDHGKIDIKLSQDKKDEWWLHVQDNGIGSIRAYECGCQSSLARFDSRSLRHRCSWMRPLHRQRFVSGESRRCGAQ